jgi:predicted ABC-type ATPase
VNKGRINNLIREQRIIIIAGSNGAGKTTFAREFLPKEAGCPVFVNADLIAAGLSPFEPATVAIRAGRMMIEEIETHVRENRGFAFETTLSGWRYEAGWRNFQQLYKKLVDTWVLYDNSGETPVLVDAGGKS